MLVQFLLLVFFFKHKTAYEMRISDWSSDVCSSDLIAVADFGDVLGNAARRIRAAAHSLFRRHLPSPLPRPGRRGVTSSDSASMMSSVLRMVTSKAGRACGALPGRMPSLARLRTRGSRRRLTERLKASNRSEAHTLYSSHS